VKPVLATAAVGLLDVWLYTALPVVPGAFFGWAALCCFWVAGAHAADRPEWLAKDSRVGRVLLWPYLGGARLVARLARLLGLRERVEVAPGLWVGGWPSRGPSELAHLDCTAELPRRAAPAAYRCVPMLDGGTTSSARLEEAVAQVLAWRAAGLPVLVHCAYGHGRSVAVMVVALVRLGLAPDAETALAQVRAVRPRARPTGSQWAVVQKTLTNC